MSVTIVPVDSKRSLRTFVKFPNRLYKDCPFYVPSLMLDEMKTFNPKKNPAFDFSKAKLFLAYKDGKVVGRVAAIINDIANKNWNHNEVRYGWMDFIDDKEVSKALIDAVMEFGRQNGMTSIAGPLGFTDFDPEGVVVDGFDQISTMALRYNFPYYPQHLEAMGFTKEVDWMEYKVYCPTEVPERIERIAKIVEEKYDIHVRKVTRREVLKDHVGEDIFNLINRTYCNLFDFTILPDRMVKQYINTYLKLVDLRYVPILEDKDHKLVGFGICMPSIVKAIQKSKGRLFPFGWWYLLRSMYFKHEGVLEMLLTAVEPAYLDKGLNSLLFTDLIPIAIKDGFKYAETNAELETNIKIRGPWDNFQKEQCKRRRVYGKSL